MPPKRKRAAPTGRSAAAPQPQPEIGERSEEGTPIPSSPEKSPSPERLEGRAAVAAAPPPAKPAQDPTTAFPPTDAPRTNAPPVTNVAAHSPEAPPQPRQPPPLPQPQQAPPPRHQMGGAPPAAPLPGRSHGTGKPRLTYNPLDSRDWGLECVDTNSPGYLGATQRIRPRFPHWLRAAALCGEYHIHEVRTNVERRALLDVARQLGFEPANPRTTSCRFVFVQATERIYLRSGPGNPYLGDEMAKELSRMEIEFRRYTARRDGRPEPLTPLPSEPPSHGRHRRDPMVLHWAFTDLFVHRDVIEVLRLLAFDLGVFRGRPSPSAEELALCYDAPNSVIEANYTYPIDIALEYDPRWADEVDYICRLPGKDGKPGIVPYSAEDPYPPSEMVRHNPVALHHYRNYIRPFMYNWNPTSTRCETEMTMESSNRPPHLASQLGIVFSLRWDKDEAGRVILRRWLRHSLNLFDQHGPSFRQQDEQTISLTMQELQRRRPGLDPVDLLKQAKELTPHFGMLNLCLNFAHFRRELGELQGFAGKAQYYIYMRQEDDDVYVAATARDLPVLRPQEFTLIFTPTGAFVGPSYLGVRDINTRMGEGKVLPPSMLHLINRYDTPGSTGGAEGKDARRRQRSPSRSLSHHSGSDGEGDGDKRQQHHPRRRRSEEHTGGDARHPPTAQASAPPAQTPPAPAPAPAVAYPTSMPGYPQPQQQLPQQLQPTMMMAGYPAHPVALPAAYAAPTSPLPPQQYQQQQQQQQPPPPPQPVSLPPVSLPYPQQQQQQQQQSYPPRRSRYLPPTSLPASSFYDAVMGGAQRQCPAGQTVETAVVEWRMPGGGDGAHTTPVGPPVPVTFVMDHLKREALIAPSIPR